MLGVISVFALKKVGLGFSALSLVLTEGEFHASLSTYLLASGPEMWA